jgi:hypothetical protein
MWWSIVKHSLEQSLEVLALQRQQLLKRGPAVLCRRGEDHRLHLRLAVRRHKHVLRPAQADAFRAELTCAASVLGCVRIGSNPEPAQLVSPAQDGVEILVEWRC